MTNFGSLVWVQQPYADFFSFIISITAQKMKFSIKDFFSKRDQIRKKLRICSHLLKKCLI